MKKINIPGLGELDIRHVVMDFNGTIAKDGRLVHGIKEKISQLTEQVTVHVITADTFGFVKKELEDINIIVKVITEKNQAQSKADYVKNLGAEHTLSVGNGANDKLMLACAKIGVAVLGDEGLAVSALISADILIKDIMNLFELLNNPKKLIAGLRI